MLELLKPLLGTANKTETWLSTILQNCSIENINLRRTAPTPGLWKTKDTLLEQMKQTKFWFLVEPEKLIKYLEGAQVEEATQIQFHVLPSPKIYIEVARKNLKIIADRREVC